MDYLSQHIEALIFSAPKTIGLEEIKSALETAFDSKIKKDDIEKSLNELLEKYQDEQYAFEIVTLLMDINSYPKRCISIQLPNILSLKPSGNCLKLRWRLWPS